MRICLGCGKGSPPENWRCASCGYQPPVQDGFVQFAPGLAQAHEGFPPGQYPLLAKVEADHFWFKSRNQVILKSLKRHFPDLERFMEIGCGTGFVLSGVAEAFPEVRVSASEIDLAGLPFVRERVPRAEIFQMDARRIPFRDEFDVIGAFDVIEHIEEDEEVLAQMYQACRPGGGVMITVPQHPWLWSPTDDHACHKRRYTRKELVRKMKKAGFEVVETLSFVSLLLPVMLASRLKNNSVEEMDPLRELTLPKPLNQFLFQIMKIEHTLQGIGLRLPFGGSLLCVGKK